jgi:hypothetical protein
LNGSAARRVWFAVDHHAREVLAARPAHLHTRSVSRPGAV